MASDGKPSGTALHATAVAIAGRAILILGPSKSGKSSLAAALIARSTRSVPILLIGDDRVLVQRVGTRLMARAHPRIAGFLERRGLGIVASPFIEQAAVDGIICLGSIMPHSDLANFPMLRVVYDGNRGVMVDQPFAEQVFIDQVLSWSLGGCDAAARTQVVAKDDGGATSTPKD